MPLLVSPITITPAVQANEFIVTAISIVERNITTGLPLPAPLVELSWVKRLNGVVVQSGSSVVDGVALGQTQADGALNIRGNLKRLVYEALQRGGVFPAGGVT